MSIVLAPATAVIVPPWLAFALGELGVVEDTRPGKSLARIEEYHAATNGGRAIDDVPWCASFVCFCFEHARVRSTRSKRAADYLTFGQPCLDMSPDGEGGWCYAPGSVLVFGRSDRDAKGSGHVGFSLGRSGKDVFLLGGNQGNRVSIAVRQCKDVVSSRWPHAVQLPGSTPPPPLLVG